MKLKTDEASKSTDAATIANTATSKKVESVRIPNKTETSSPKTETAAEKSAVIPQTERDRKSKSPVKSDSKIVTEEDTSTTKTVPTGKSKLSGHVRTGWI